MIFLIFGLAIFFALNMGGSSFAASFAAAYGGKVLNRLQSSLLFILFVVLGAVAFGSNVSITLGKDIVPTNLITPKALVIIFATASFSMFSSNLMKIPQSTSLVTVAAIAGVGAYSAQVNLKTIAYLVPFWILLPVISFAIIYWIGKYLYPPRASNFWIYERIVNHKQRLKYFVILASCYNAFSVGTNNVANVVGPLVSSDPVKMMPALLVMGFVFGSGSVVFSGPIKTAGQQIVPLGLLTASFVAFVCGSLMIVASLLGVPQSFVMLKLAALFGLSSLKKGTESTFQNPVTQKTIYSWGINPILTFIFAYVFSILWLGRI